MLVIKMIDVPELFKFNCDNLPPFSYSPQCNQQR